MLSRTGRPLAQVIFGPIAKVAVKLGISANTITVVGTLLSSTVAILFFSKDWLISGSLLVAVLVIFDNLDGQIARLTGTASKWGAFLDSTMDRFADAAICTGLLLWGYFHLEGPMQTWMLIGGLLALIFGSIVPYARARAEGVGWTAAVGIAERADRLVISLVATLLVGLGLPDVILVIAMWILAVAAFITIVQRMVVVYKQAVADPSNLLAPKGSEKQS